MTKKRKGGGGLLTPDDSALIEGILKADCRQKAMARPKGAVGKKRPGKIVTPSALRGRRNAREPPWWLAAPPVVHVDIVTGEVLVNRWPFPDPGHYRRLR